MQKKDNNLNYSKKYPSMKTYYFANANLDTIAIYNLVIAANDLT